jgi:hypothetical protein
MPIFNHLSTKIGAETNRNSKATEKRTVMASIEPSIKTSSQARSQYSSFHVDRQSLTERLFAAD